MTPWPKTLVLTTLATGMAACPGSPTAEPAKTEAKAAAPKVEPPKVEVTKAEPTKVEPPKVEPEVAPPVEAPPAAAGLVPSPLPGVEDAATPAVVFAALADRNSGEWEVDITDFSGMDVKKLEKKLEAAMMSGEGEGEGGDEFGDEEDAEAEKEPPNILETKAGKALVPAGFAVGDPWTLVTPKGAEHRTAKGFRAVMMEGSGTLHFYVGLGKAPAGTEKPAVALRGHLPVATKLAVPKPVEPITLGPAVLDAIVGAYSKDMDPEVHRIFVSLPAEPEDVKLFPGRFPGNRTHAAFLLADVEDDDDPPLSAFLFVKSDGSAEAFAIPDVLGTVELLGLLDVDGDGRDEVFYEDGYHEGWYLRMLQWDGDTPRARTLTGDGI